MVFPRNDVSTSLTGCREELFEFEALLEIQENNMPNDYIFNGQKSTFSPCPLDRNCFKMRRNRERKVVVMLKQITGPMHLRVKNCFGMLLAAGRNLRHSDMHLLEMQSAVEGQNNPQVLVVESRWNPCNENFEVLNTETPRESRVWMTVSLDIIFETLEESMRFNLECKARILQQFELFFRTQRRTISEKYKLLIQMIMTEQPPESINDFGSCIAEQSVRKVLCFESATEHERQKARNALIFDKEKSPIRQLPTQLIHPMDGSDSDSDEPLLSGSGDVCRECSEDRMIAWKELLESWKKLPEQKPSCLNSLIHDGIPDVMRGEVWILLSRVGSGQSDLIQAYQMLLEKECPSESVILRDIHRTFPAHEYFKDECGQKALFRISKAYSIYDEEVGYCQGLSFLAAALLLHMSEEQAFCVLIRIMFDYGMRELFKTGFDALHLRFHQLQRLIKDYVPDLYLHFTDVGIETHMYASQWFLTLFTAKFTLQMVFFIVDLFLAEGMNTIFHISLALLQDSKRELLHSDFEGILKFFRVNLPRKYRTETNAKELIHAAVKLKISHKRLAKYEKEWHELKRQEIESQDPLDRLQRENCRLKEQILRLERENDDLAYELVTSKINLQAKLDTTEDQLETTLTQVVRKNRECEELIERERQLREESESIKQTCRNEVSRLEGEQHRTEGVLSEYKRICSDLGLSAEEDKRQFMKQKRLITARIASCDRCSVELADLLIVENSSPKRSESALSSSDNDNLPCLGKDLSLMDASTSTGTSAIHMMELVEKLQQYEFHIRQVELELAQTKLALVESQCQNQDLSHQMSASMMLQQIQNGSDIDNRPAWLRKTISSLREVAAQAHGVGGSSSNNGNATGNGSSSSVSQNSSSRHQQSTGNISSNPSQNKYIGNLGKAERR